MKNAHKAYTYLLNRGRSRRGATSAEVGEAIYGKPHRMQQNYSRPGHNLLKYLWTIGLIKQELCTENGSRLWSPLLMPLTGKRIERATDEQLAVLLMAYGNWSCNGAKVQKEIWRREEATPPQSDKEGEG